MNSIGIDLGTTNSVACTIRHGKYKFLQFYGEDLLKSVILYRDGKITVGKAAKRQAVLYPENFISSSKTYMGSSQTWNIDGRRFTPTDVAAEILKEIYKAAQNFFDNAEKIEAVITVPEQFSAKQREETKKAGERAGFIVKKILTEPVAAAVAYAFENPKPNEKIYVADLGGGTFDVALLESRGGNSYRTLIQDGNRKLGGNDFDKAIVNLMMREVRITVGVNLSALANSGLSAAEYNSTLQKLYTEAEKVKIALSTSESEQVDIVNLFPYQDDFYNLQMTITRQDFLDKAAILVNEIRHIIKNSFKGKNFSAANVDRVILVGGSSNMPCVQDYVEKFFNKQPYADMDPSKLVAMGAAILADGESGKGIQQHDIISHSLGIRIKNDRMRIMLPQNTEYPCKYKHIFKTSSDNQESVPIDICEGEDTENFYNNIQIGGFKLEGIAIARRGKEIEVSFSLDENGILHVRAKDPTFGVKKEIEINL